MRAPAKRSPLETNSRLGGPAPAGRSLLSRPECAGMCGEWNAEKAAGALLASERLQEEEGEKFTLEVPTALRSANLVTVTLRATQHGGEPPNAASESYAGRIGRSVHFWTLWALGGGGLEISAPLERRWRVL